MPRYPKGMTVHTLPGAYHSGRATKAQLEFTADKLLKGAGAGADPTEVDVPAGVPSGIIGLWHGLIANIPSGWVICDGNNSTPNLLAKFVEGVATAATNPGATGGATAKTTAGHYHSPGGAYRNDPALVVAGATGWLDSNGFIVFNTASKTDSIADIRPLFYDIAFIMKT